MRFGSRCLGSMMAPSDLVAQADSVASSYDLEPSILKGLVEQESSWDPKATRQEPRIHDASYGLTQVLLGTAREMGYTGDAAGLMDPATGLDYGANYLRQQLDKFGDYRLALAAYNGGPGHVQDAIDAADGDLEQAWEHLSQQTKDYAISVISKAQAYLGSEPSATVDIVATDDAQKGGASIWLLLGLVAVAGGVWLANR